MIHGPASDDIGWRGQDHDAPDVAELREHLQRHNGLTGLDVVEPGDVQRAVRIFRRDGFVVIGDVLDAEQCEILRSGVVEVAREILALDDARDGNRGSHRYSFGGSTATRRVLHRPEGQMLLDVTPVLDVVEAIFESSQFTLRSASGDFCLPGATGYQPLHSDMGDYVDERSSFSSFHDPRGMLTTRDLPTPYICANFLPFDQTRINGPTRPIPGSQHARGPIPTLDDEPEWMRLSTVCPVPAGAVQLRDVRAWHGGTPNVSDELRAIPNLEFYAPWFREPTVPGIEFESHQRLSPRAQEITRFSVLDSSQRLEPSYSVTPFRPRT
ncbi:MAG: phytanoyl-CoA dioxygenase family protein [Ilumatobacter sp.]